MQSVSLSQQRGSNELQGCPRVLSSSFFLVTFSQLFDSFRKPPECWADSPYTKWSTVVARRVGVSVLSAAFTVP